MRRLAFERPRRSATWDAALHRCAACQAGGRGLSPAELGVPAPLSCGDWRWERSAAVVGAASQCRPWSRRAWDLTVQVRSAPRVGKERLVKMAAKAPLRPLVVAMGTRGDAAWRKA